jgi:hypothetical protein
VSDLRRDLQAKMDAVNGKLQELNDIVSGLDGATFSYIEEGKGWGALHGSQSNAALIDRAPYRVAYAKKMILPRFDAAKSKIPTIKSDIVGKIAVIDRILAEEAMRTKGKLLAPSYKTEREWLAKAKLQAGVAEKQMVALRGRVEGWIRDDLAEIAQAGKAPLRPAQAAPAGRPPNRPQ